MDISENLCRKNITIKRGEKNWVKHMDHNKA